MARKKSEPSGELAPAPAGRPSPVLDTRVIYCGDNIEQLKKLPDGCVDDWHASHCVKVGLTIAISGGQARIGLSR